MSNLPPLSSLLVHAQVNVRSVGLRAFEITVAKNGEKSRSCSLIRSRKIKRLVLIEIGGFFELQSSKVSHHIL